MLQRRRRSSGRLGPKTRLGPIWVCAVPSQGGAFQWVQIPPGEATAAPVRHRQTKGADTDMPSLPPPRHISTLPELLKCSLDVPRVAVLSLWARSVGEVPERSNGAVSKTVVPLAGDRGFESLPLRQSINYFNTLRAVGGILHQGLPQHEIGFVQRPPGAGSQQFWTRAIAPRFGRRRLQRHQRGHGQGRRRAGWARGCAESDHHAVLRLDAPAASGLHPNPVLLSPAWTESDR
jgi:hypothetical protein